MSKGLVAGLVVTAGIVSAAMVFGLLWVNAHNAETSLRNEFAAQQKTNESSFDKTWKIIQQQAGVASHERQSFRETYVEIMDATEGVAGQGALASFFTQAKIDVSPELFSKLMTSIEAQRESFHRDQQHLLKIKQQHDDVRMRFPSTLFVGGRSALEPRLVTSAKADEVFAAGQDNDIELFQGGN